MMKILKNLTFTCIQSNLLHLRKKKIDSLYEKLKEKVFYSKIENDVFSNYVSHAQALVKGVVDIISEERNGKCYTAAGKRVNTEITSLVLNEVL